MERVQRKTAHIAVRYWKTKAAEITGIGDMAQEYWSFRNQQEMQNVKTKQHQTPKICKRDMKKQHNFEATEVEKFFTFK